MGRDKQAPENFDCPYRKSCPHMNGISAAWALAVFQEADIERNEHSRIREMMAAEIDGLHICVEQLEEENAQLKAKIKALGRPGEPLGSRDASEKEGPADRASAMASAKARSRGQNDAGGRTGDLPALRMRTP